MGKRSLSLFLALIMLLSACSLSAFATNVFTEGDFAYSISESGATIVSYNGENTVVSVPEKIGNYQVISIAEYAFQESAVTVLNLPDGIEALEENALAQSSIATVYIPASCSTVAENALEKGTTIYGFGDSNTAALAEQLQLSFEELNDVQSYKSFVGKTINLNSLNEDASLLSQKSFVDINENSVKAVAKGKDIILLSLSNGIEAPIIFTISAAPKKINGLPTSLTLYVGDTYSKLTPSVSASYDGVFSYSVKNTKIAKIDAVSGKLNALHPGKTEILVRFEDSVSASVPLTVGYEVTDFQLDAHELNIGVLEPAKLTYTTGKDQIIKSVTFSSSNQKVAVISADGVISARKVGVCTLKAKMDNGLTDSCILKVGKAPSSVKFAKSTVNAGVGEKFKLTPIVNQGAVCSTFYYRSSDTKVLSVDKYGKVTAKKIGTAKLYVYPYNYKTQNPTIKNYAVIQVKKAPSYAKFNKSNLVLGVGEKFDLNCVLAKNTASFNRSVVMEDSHVAANGSGMIITGKSVGETNFTLTTFNGKSANCRIKVKPAPQKVFCKPTKIKLSLNQTYQLEPYVNQGAVCSTYKFVPSNKKVCTVSAAGLVKVKDYGTCFIHIYTYNHTSKKPITCKVKIQVGYITHKIASYTTYFDQYYWGKSVNLKMACKYINGKSDGFILQPGQTFSFNSAVGPRTSARGFVDAKVIEGNDYVDGIGGGICQAATTVFNATLLGNLQPVERHNHNLKSSYCPVGRDATVSWGSQDYKFKNNYNTPIRIKMNYNAGGSINCSIYTLKKVNVPKISLIVTYSSGVYTLKRYAGGKVNYTTVSSYAD